MVRCAKPRPELVTNCSIGAWRHRHVAVLPMLILAIDTALDACAAAVLDTDAGRLIAQESLPMKRGHAEALMPLIARVMQASGVASRARPNRGDHRPGSFTGLRVGLSAARGIALAAGKPVVGLTTLSAYAAPLSVATTSTPMMSAIDARHDHVYFQVVSGNGSSLIAAAGRADRGSARRRALRRAASGRQCGADLADALAGADAPPPFKVDAQPAPDIAWLAWLGAAASPRPRPPGRIICARPTPSRRTAPAASAHADGRHDVLVAGFWAQRPPWSSPRRSRCAATGANCMARRFIAAGAKTNSRSMLAERNTLVASVADGTQDRRLRRRREWRPMKPKSSRSRLRPGASRPRPVAQSAADPSRPSRRPRRAARCFSRSRKTISRRGGSTNEPDFAWSDAANAIIGKPTGNN